ncbi:MAG: VWA domain-containing protein [Terracidiphilus sp.]|nr:VWA domain-containing protein [Terracidiphilus sp.]MDR3798203.1 VWA domain-containing protein [Terracidiphilus sp.]
MKTKSKFCLALSLAAVSVLASYFLRPSRAAQQPSPNPSPQHPIANLKVQAREVLLPVVVEDKHGALVTNLTAKDFTLAEDGRPQVIKSFTSQSNLPFRLGLLVDTSHSVSSAMDVERRAAGKFIDLMLPADPKDGVQGDEAFLIHFDREVELLEDFTNSRDKLHHELDGMGPTSRERNNQGPETSGDDRGGNGGYGQHGGGRFGSGTQLYDAIYLASDELMKSKSGRKALIVFSDGADHGSKETLNDAVDAAEHANLQVFTIYFKGEQDRGNGGFPGNGGHRGGGGYPGGGGGYPGGGGGYPGGGGGHRGGNPKSEAGVDGKKIMEQIASRTGGQFFEAKKKDNLDEIYNQIAASLRQQYLLTYTPDKVDTDGGFHKIVLKTEKSDLNVITREGYYAPTPDK